MIIYMSCLHPDFGVPLEKLGFPPRKNARELAAEIDLNQN
jgi:hypothetical protein